MAEPTLKWLAGLVGSASVLLGAAFAVDKMYVRSADAADAFQRATVARERGDLETQRELYEIKLRELQAADTPQAEKEMKYILQRIEVIDRRLLELSHNE